MIFTLLSVAAFPQGGQKFSDAGNILSTSSFIGSINAMPFVIKTNNTQKAVFTTAGWFGLGITAPTCMFDVFGDGKILNFNIVSNLIVGNSLSVKKIFSPNGTIDFDGNNISTSNEIIAGKVITPKIWSAGGIIDFDACNLKTTAGITASTLGISGNGTFGNVTANSFQNPLFAGVSNGIVLTDAEGNFKKLGFDGNTNSVLLGNGSFGTLPENLWIRDINNNVYIIDYGKVGIGTTTPLANLHIKGITDLSEILDTAITPPVVDSTIIPPIIIVPPRMEKSATLRIEDSLINSANDRTVYWDLAVSADKQKIYLSNNGAGNEYDVLSIKETGEVGIGTNEPVEKLDVAGNANIRGYLYVQDGVIIGKRIDGQRVNSDTIDVKKLAIRYATTDSLTSLKLATEKMAVSRDINIGEQAKIGTNIIIDGLTNNITTPGSITAGSITAGTMNVTNQSITNLNVSGGIKVGNSSIIIGDFNETGTANNIYTENSDNLFIQSLASSTNNTIINNNEGMVGIGTDAPYKKLTVNGDVSFANYFSGNALENPGNGMSAFEILGNNQIPTRRGISLDSDLNGNLNFWIHTWQSSAFNFMRKDNDNASPDATNLMTILKNGDVGIGTSNPQKTLHVKTTHQNTGGSEYMGSMRIENEVLGGSTSIWDFEPFAGNITDYTDNLRFVANGNTNVMTLYEDGKVGIGTTNAIGTLQVGNSSSKVVIGDGFAIPLPDEYWNASYLGFNAGRDNSGNWIFDTDGAHNGGNVMLSTIFGDIRFISIPTTNAGTSSKFLTDQQLLSHTKMVINSNGIGIGTDNPTADLEVNGIIKCSAINMNGSPFNNVWTKSGENIFNSTTGNVGIGTSTPTLAKLHVKDDLSAQVFVIEGGETGTYMSWYHQNRQAWAGFYTNDNFELKNETPNGHILLTTTGTGKIGIGTYTPTEKLHIKDGSIYIDGEGQGLIVNEGGHKRVSFMKYANHEAGIWRVQNQDFEIGRLNSVDMLPGYPSITDFLTDIYIANDGKIGFGTNDPSESFEVYGNGNISLRGSGNDAGDIIFKNNNPASQLGRIWTNSDSQSGLFLSSGDVTPDITIKNDGFVGIGTTNPSEKLTVKGKILAAEFEIQKYDDIPDYVFAPDYKLLSLQEIENYIKQNQHLPDVPSAKEFEENGINLGELNFLLLKKVEELTLYMIELQKKNEQLEKVIVTLKK